MVTKAKSYLRRGMEENINLTSKTRSIISIKKILKLKNLQSTSIAFAQSIAGNAQKTVDVNKWRSSEALLLARAQMLL